MAGVAIVLTSARPAPKALEAGFARARALGGELSVAFIADSDAPQSLYNLLQHLGFLENDAGEELFECLMEEYGERLEAAVQRICEHALSTGLQTEPRVLRGPFVSQFKAFVTMTAPDEVVVSRNRKSHHSRFIFTGRAQEAIANTAVPVTIADEDTGDDPP